MQGTMNIKFEWVQHNETLHFDFLTVSFMNIYLIFTFSSSITSSHCLPCLWTKWKRVWRASCVLQIAGEENCLVIRTTLLSITELHVLIVSWCYCHRLRPDIRKLEEGDIDGAAAEKTRLEEKQRDARKARKGKKGLDWAPRYVMYHSARSECTYGRDHLMSVHMQVLKSNMISVHCLGDINVTP